MIGPYETPQAFRAALKLGLPALTLQEAYAYLQAVWEKWKLSQPGDLTTHGDM